MSATIHDVARAAGVSTATVGRVLHNKGYVSEEARKKIEQAVQELGYVPSQSARSLKGGKSGLIGCLVRQNINGLYYKIVKSVSEEAEKHGYETITMEADHPGKEADLVRNFIGLRVDGLVIISDEFVDAKSLQALKQAGIPVAAAERDYLDFGIDSLLVTDRKAVREAVLKMTEKGHRRILFLGARNNSRTEVENERLAGFQEGILEAGVEKESRFLLTDDYEPESARESMRKILSSDWIPTAVVCGSDTLAAGVLQAAYEKGLKVPEELSVSGYDDVLAAYLSPAINSVSLILDKTGEQLMALLEARRKDPEKPAECLSIETAYHDRGTVAENHSFIH